MGASVYAGAAKTSMFFAGTSIVEKYGFVELAVKRPSAPGLRLDMGD